MGKYSKNQGVALVTGAGQRIGRVIAKSLACDGWALAIHCNKSTTQAKSLVRNIVSAGGKAKFIKADLSSESDTSKLIDQAKSVVGPVTCLINNASVFEHDDINTSTEVLWNLHMAVNFRAPFILIQKMSEQLPKKTKGNVINLLDQRVWNPTPSFTSYTLSKMALWNLTQTLALTLAPKIRVNGIGPGPVYPSKRQNIADFKSQWSNLPLARRIKPEEIANGIRFILDAKAMTGQMIALDSGEHLGWSSHPDVNIVE